MEIAQYFQIIKLAFNDFSVLVCWINGFQKYPPAALGYREPRQPLHVATTHTGAEGVGMDRKTGARLPRLRSPGSLIRHFYRVLPLKNSHLNSSAKKSSSLDESNLIQFIDASACWLNFIKQSHVHRCEQLLPFRADEAEGRRTMDTLDWMLSTEGKAAGRSRFPAQRDQAAKEWHSLR